MEPASLIEPATELAHAAGRAILDVYGEEFEVERKADDTPLTRADLAAHRIIAGGLGDLKPALPLISEEGGLPPYSSSNHHKKRS